MLRGWVLGTLFFHDPEVRKAEHLQGGLFKGLQDGTQYLAGTGPAGDDVIVGAKDGAFCDDLHRHAGKQLTQTLAGVHVHMRGQAVTQFPREIVDKGDVTKVILTAPVDAVSLKAIAAVGAENHHTSAGFEGAHDLVSAFMVVLNVFQYLVTQDQIKGIVGEGQEFTHTAQHVGAFLVGIQGTFKFNIQTDGKVAGSVEAHQVRAKPAAVLKNAAIDAITGGIEHHLQAALLAVAPHVRGFAA
ncbi:hypothetical protein SDC9_171066 [bioreactor metagenome]|uniref:Uncharacterized protein n=1 Tax=bioreactor metagenome TaxID=1076179 RepID=A0A645GIX2_9ZZZZ